MAEILSQKTPFDKLFQRAGEQYGVDPRVLKSMAFVESSFNPEAVGPKTKYGRAQGLMQFMPATARAYKLRNPFDPNQAVPAAARYMKDLITQFDGDLSKALEAYNGGPRLVGRSSQTKQYAQKVMAAAGLTPAVQQEAPAAPEPIIAAQATPQQGSRTMDQGDGANAVLESAQLALSQLPNYAAALSLFMDQGSGDTEEEYNQYAEAFGPEMASVISDYEPVAMARGGYVDKLERGGVPRQSEVPQLDESGRVITTPVVPGPPEKDFSALDYLLGAADVGSTILKSTVVEPYALARGLYEQAKSGEAPTSRRVAEKKAEEIRQAARVAPRTEAGGQMLQSIAKMAQDAKIPSIVPQLMGLPVLQRGSVGQGAVLATEEAVLPVMRKITGNADLTPGQIYSAMGDTGATLRAGAPAAAPRTPVDATLLTPSQRNPFVGEMEKRIADLPGAVRKEQFLNSLKGKARDYEIVRMEQALEGFDANAKLTPQQLMDAVRSTSPQRYNLDVIEPKAGAFYAHMDNPYPNQPVGTVNLTLRSSLQQQTIADAVADASSLKNRYWGFTDVATKPEALNDLVTSSNKLADALEGFSSSGAEKIRKATTRLEQESAPLVEATNRLRGVQFPFTDKRMAALEFGNLKETVDPKIAAYLKDNGIDIVGDNLRYRLKYLTIATARDNLNEAVKAYNTLPDASPSVERSLAKWNKQIDSYLSGLKTLDEPDLFQKPAAERAQMLALADKFEKLAFDFTGKDRDFKILSSGVEQRGDKLYRQLKGAIQDAVDSEDIQKNLGYRGTHRSIVSDNPISFARFVDLDSSTPGINDPRGAMFFPELQSDRYKAVRKEVIQKDLRTGEPMIDPETGKYVMRGNFSYDPSVEEAYPGMATLSPDIIQQLIMKSTVGAAAKRGKGIVLFPSTDSAQPQLYGKVERNAKQVAKDMGKGYEARQFEVANEKGEMIKRWGIILPEDAQERIGKEGIRFAKGGMVDKPLYDRA